MGAGKQTRSKAFCPWTRARSRSRGADNAVFGAPSGRSTTGRARRRQMRGRGRACSRCLGAIEAAAGDDRHGRQQGCECAHGGRFTGAAIAEDKTPPTD